MVLLAQFQFDTTEKGISSVERSFTDIAVSVKLMLA